MVFRFYRPWRQTRPRLMVSLSCPTYLRKTIFYSLSKFCLYSFCFLWHFFRRIPFVLFSAKLLAKRIVWKKRKKNYHLAFSIESEEEEKITVNVKESPFINCMKRSSNLPLQTIWTSFTRKNSGKRKKKKKRIKRKCCDVEFLP